jgi:membrane protein
MPPEAARLVQPEIERLIREAHPGILSFGIASALFLATGGMNAVIKAMNRAYGVEETRPFWKKYTLALGLTLLACTAVVVAFVLFILGQVFGVEISVVLGLEQEFAFVMDLVYWPVVMLLLLMGTAFVYWAAPNMDLQLRWITPGAMLATVLWLASTAVFSTWVENFGSYGVTYGALGGVAVLLIWFYLSAFILLVGAEINEIIDERVDPEGVVATRNRKNAEAARRRGDAPPSDESGPSSPQESEQRSEGRRALRRSA